MLSRTGRFAALFVILGGTAVLATPSSALPPRLECGDPGPHSCCVDGGELCSGDYCCFFDGGPAEFCGCEQET